MSWTVNTETNGAGLDRYDSIENLLGSNHNDRLWGDDNTNLIEGSEGDDRIAARGGNDILYGGLGNDELNGDDGRDRLFGQEGNDTLSGGDSHDTLDGGAGNDRLDGGSGADFVTYQNASGGVYASLEITGAQDTRSAGVDTFVGIENLHGSDFNDRLWGDDGNNVIIASYGNDIVAARAGDDTVYGGRGADRLIGEAGDDVFYPGDTSYRANDTIEGGAGSDTVDYSATTLAVRVDLSQSTGRTREGAGFDVLIDVENIIGSDATDRFSFNGDRLVGSAANNFLDGRGQGDYLDGRAGDDTIMAGSGNDTVYGGDGNDSLNSGSGEDWMDGGAGNDYLLGKDADLWGGSGDDVIVSLGRGLLAGEDGNDLLVSRGAFDVAHGGNHDDRFIIEGFGDFFGEHGDDVFQPSGFGQGNIRGGDGSDTVDYSQDSIPVEIDLGGGTAVRSPTADDFDDISDSLGSIENAVGSKSADSIVGSSASNYLSGSSGNDTISAGSGDDTVRGGPGNDVLDGGGGVDTVDYSDVPQGISARLYVDGPQNAGLAGVDTLIGFENIQGSNHDDRLWGTSGSNILNGGAGDDVFDGQAGSDTFNGGDGLDTVSYLSESSGVNVNLQITGAQQINAGGDLDMLTSIEGVWGSAFADELIGDGNGNRLLGYGGDDRILVSAGFSTILGGEGNDSVSILAQTEGRISGDAGTDTLSVYLDGASADPAFTQDLGALIKFVDQQTDEVTGVADEDVFVFSILDLQIKAFESVAVYVDDQLNTAPVLLPVGDLSVSEGVLQVGAVAASDEQGHVIRYAVVGGDDSDELSVDPISGQISFNQAPSYDNPSDSDGDNVYELRITASYPYGGVSAADYIVAVTEVNAAPEFDGAGEFQVNENQIAVGAVSASDSDGDSITYSLSGDDQGLFSIDSDTGVLTFISAPDFESPADADGDNVYDVLVSATDTKSAESSLAVRIAVVDVDENIAPEITTAAAFFAAENQTLAATVQATDADGDAISYSIVGGSDAALFSLGSNSGELRFAAAPNFEAPGDSGADNNYQLRIAAQDSSGARVEQDIQITVTDVDETPPNQAPVIGFGGNVNLQTEQDTGLTVTQISVSDTDASNDPLAITLSASSGSLTLSNVSGLVAIDGEGSDGTLAYSGSQAAINDAFVAGLSYVPTAGYSGSDTLTVSVSDQGNNGTGGAKSAQLSLPVTITGVPAGNTFVIENLATNGSFENPVVGSGWQTLAAPVYPNLLAQGDFESTTGIDVYWAPGTNIWGGESATVAGAVNGIVPFGNQMLQVNHAGGGSNSQVHQMLEGPFVAGTEVTFEVKMNTVQAGVEVSVDIEMRSALNAPGERISSDKIILDTDPNTWETVSVTTTLGSDVNILAPEIIVFHSFPGGFGSLGAYVDGAVLTAAAPGVPPSGLPGWDIREGSIEVIGTFWQAAEGNQSLDMNGNEPGRIVQLLDTEAGSNYHVSFNLSKNEYSGIAALTATVEASAGSSIQRFDFSDTVSLSDMKWAQHMFTFTANHGVTPLQFESLAPAGASGPALDNVVVVEHQTITGFSASGDILDFSQLLESIGAPRDNTVFSMGWLEFDSNSSGTVISVDTDGGGDNLMPVVTLVGVVLNQTDADNYVL